MVRIFKRPLFTNPRKIVIKIFLLFFIFVFILILKWGLNLRGIKLTFYEIDLSLKFKSHFLVDTSTCRIPHMPQMTNGRVSKIPDCDYETTFSVLVQDETHVKLDKNYTRHKFCTLHSLSAGGVPSTMGKLRQVTYINNLEMFYTKCNNNALNFHVTLPVTPEVQAKLEFWSDVPVEEKPFNVLFFGFDTVSRSHFYRSLPKTVKILREMNFVDFKGFHSLSSNTKVNIAAFIMGFKTCLNCPTIFPQNNCTKSFEHYLDSCPMIFNDFSIQNYITMYMDNEMFEFTPLHVESPISDYYVQSFFEIVSKIRNKMDPLQNECISRESSPQFMLRYNQRFISKFQRVPFFGFTWFSRPFRQHSFSLANFDEDFVKFFKFLQSQPHILRKTFIIMSGDGGAETFFNLERALPPLFIRVPQFLQDKYPNLNLKQNLLLNSQRLTSPFDVHHTLRHLLNLTVISTADKHFQPILHDRSSLFHVVRENRTCHSFHVHNKQFCACNNLLRKSGTGKSPNKLLFQKFDPLYWLQ